MYTLPNGECEVTCPSVKDRYTLPHFPVVRVWAQVVTVDQLTKLQVHICTACDGLCRCMYSAYQCSFTLIATPATLSPMEGCVEWEHSGDRVLVLQSLEPQGEKGVAFAPLPCQKGKSPAFTILHFQRSCWARLNLRIYVGTLGIHIAP